MKKKNIAYKDNKKQKDGDDRSMKDEARAARNFRKICMVILVIAVTLGILTFSFWLNYQVITGGAQSNILFWKMAD